MSSLFIVFLVILGVALFELSLKPGSKLIRVDLLVA